MDSSRITLRCFSEDLGLVLPNVDSELAAGCDELWVAVSTVDLSGAGVEPRTRDMGFAMVESVAGPGEWEAVSAWPNGELSWFEVARYGLLEA